MFNRANKFNSIQSNLCSSHRYALVTDGQHCFCMKEIAADLAPKPKSECSSPCSGDPKQVCGGPEQANDLLTYSVWAATCPAGAKRFGEHCLFEASASLQSIERNQDMCAEEVRGTQIAE